MNHVFAALLMLTGWLNSNHFLPWVSWHSELPFFLLMWLAAAFALHKGESWIEMPAPIWPIALLVAVLCIQGVVGAVAWRGQVLTVSLYLGLMAVAMTWGWREAKSSPNDPVLPKAHRAGEWLAWSVIVGCILSIGISLAQVLQVWGDASFIVRQPGIRRPGANLAQPNHLATLLVMGMGAALFLNMQRRIGAGVLAMLAFLFSMGVAVTESRSGLLATWMLCGLWAWKRPSEGAAIARTWSLWHVVATTTMFALWPTFYRWWAGGYDGEAGMERLVASGEDPRWLLWRQMFEASLLQPWFGWGIRDTAEAHNAVVHEASSALAVTYSHNIVLDLAVWIGWPLAIAMVLAIIMWWWGRLRVVDSAPLTWFGMALLIPFGVHSLFEFPFAYAYLLMPAMLGVGYLAAVTNPGAAAVRVHRWVAAVAILALGVLGAWSVVDYVRVEEDFRMARFQMLRIGPPPSEPPPRVLALNQLSDLVASTRVPLQRALGVEQMTLLREAALHYPWSGSQYRYATALALNGDSDEARRQLRVLLAQQGFKVYRPLAAQLEQELAKRGLPALGVPLEKQQLQQ
ncbi:O-antigen ligase C-terminal domain-containing protein [Hydrogenophaga sp. YM1]|uniref:PglL family O-oligosaccharyltransferase n=1 Tax=Hydrogenophaga sp. YM1 TaxID=2806262 RepID=UPI00195B8795|nr:O-antigen ligase family protein [Hydrogenophaga sp. YM1]QRR34261.1 O-antigen ligase C-terminal domain-containing protein [Hydrogenophaga sp. YM1]